MRVLRHGSRLLAEYQCAALCRERCCRRADQADIARAVLQGDDWTLSIQVLQEFVVQATRASRIQRSWRRANKRLHLLLTEDLSDAGLDGGVEVRNPFRGLG